MADTGPIRFVDGVPVAAAPTAPAAAPLRRSASAGPASPGARQPRRWAEHLDGSWASEDFAPPLPRVNPSAEDSGSAGPPQLARDSPDGARRQSYQTSVEAVPARYHTGITREDLYHRKGVVGETSSWYLPRHGRKPALDKADKKKAEMALENGWDVEFGRGFLGGGSKLKTQYHTFPLAMAKIDRGLKVRLIEDPRKVGRCTKHIRAPATKPGSPAVSYEHMEGMAVQRMGAATGDAYSRGTLRGLVITMHAQQGGPHAFVDPDPNAVPDMALAPEDVALGMKVHMTIKPQMGGKVLKTMNDGAWVLVEFPQASMAEMDELGMEKERSEDPTWAETEEYLSEFQQSIKYNGPSWVACTGLTATPLAGWVPLIQLTPGTDELGSLLDEKYGHYRDRNLVRLAALHAHVNTLGWVPMTELSEDYEDMRMLYRPDYGRSLAPSRKALLRADPSECCGFRGHKARSEREIEEEMAVAGGAEAFSTESMNYKLYSPASRIWATAFN